MVRQRFGIAVLFLTVLLSVNVQAAQKPKTVVRIAHKWDENNKWHLAFNNAAAAFMQKYPDISVQVETAWIEDKYKVGVATGEAPDIYLLWDSPTWGAGGYVQAVDQLAAQFNVRRSDFVPAAWDQYSWRGKLYAVPIQIDPNFGLVWNKTLFAEAGLHPDRAPATVQEFDQYFKRLTKFNSDGTPVRLGMTPWNVYGTNGVYTWGWLFGGEWYDYAAGKATAHHPGNIQALEYLTDYFQRYSSAFDALGKGIPTGMSRFTSGREAMQLLTPSATFMTMQANKDMSLGIGKMFNNPQVGVQNAAWIGGYALGLTAGCKHPAEAFQLIQYLTADPTGIALFAEPGSWMPANMKAPYFRELGSDPLWRVFTETAMSTVRYRPAIPALGTYNTQLNALFPKIIRRQITPNAAMEELSKMIDLEIATKYSN